MTLPGLRRRSSLGQHPDRWSDMLRGAAVAVLVLGTVVSALVAHGWQQTIDRQREERLDRAANSRTVTIEGAMADYENALQAARSLWIASGAVDRKEFNAFARSLDLRERTPGLQGIGWRSFVTDGQRAAFLARARADGEPGFTIRPPGRRPVYYVTLYGYPRIPSSSTLGADARAVPSVLATLDQAKDSGRTTLSNQTTLAGDRDLPARERPAAFELYVPVYRRELPRGWSWTTRRSRTAARWPATPRGSGHRGPTSSMPPPVVLVAGVALSVLFAAMLWLLAQVGALYREVGRLARTDSLTGVPNRRAWDEELPRALARAARSGEPVCVALLDLDHFKDYNDRPRPPGRGPVPQGGGRRLAGRGPQDRPGGPLRRGGVRHPAPRLRAGQCRGDRRAAPHRPARGHLLARGGPVGRP